MNLVLAFLLRNVVSVGKGQLRPTMPELVKLTLQRHKNKESDQP